MTNNDTLICWWYPDRDRCDRASRAGNAASALPGCWLGVVTVGAPWALEERPLPAAATGIVAGAPTQADSESTCSGCSGSCRVLARAPATLARVIHQQSGECIYITNMQNMDSLSVLFCILVFGVCILVLPVFCIFFTNWITYFAYFAYWNI